MVSNFAGGSPIFQGGLQPEYGQCSAGMHPTGMHSCLSSIRTVFIDVYQLCDS